MDRAPAPRWWSYIPAAVAWLLYAPTLKNHLYTHDGWNDVMLGMLAREGGLPLHENIFRLVPTLSFGLRGAWGLSMPIWHLPNVLLHGLNAALITALAMRLGLTKWAALLSGLLFASTPLLAHPVEWIGGSYDIFATTGVLACALAHAYKRTGWAIVAALFALMSKEAAVGLAIIIALLSRITTNNQPNKQSWRSTIRSAVPILIVTVVVGAIRWIQFAITPEDAMAGRSVSLDIPEFLTSIPAAIGIAATGSLAELISLERGNQSLSLGYAAIALLTVGFAIRRNVAKPVAWMVTAGVVALIPVSLIAMNVDLMVENTRYLYLSAALTSPLLPLLLLGNAKRPHLVGSCCAITLVLVAAWGTSERVSRSARHTAAVAPVVDKVASLPAHSRVFVLTNLYDEATARFLMSRWLNKSKKINARYVMVGTWTMYSRRGQGAYDAAQSYFGPELKPFTPNLLRQTDLIFRQDPATATLTPMDARAFQARSTGPWVEIKPNWVPARPPDPDDSEIKLEGQTIQVERFYGPVAQSEFYPHIWSPLTDTGQQLNGVQLQLQVNSAAEPRYGAGYHELWGALFIAKGDNITQSMSFPLTPNETNQIVTLDLSFLNIRNADRIGVLGLNYPGQVTIDVVRVR